MAEGSRVVAAGASRAWNGTEDGDGLKQRATNATKSARKAAAAVWERYNPRNGWGAGGLSAG